MRNIDEIKEQQQKKKMVVNKNYIPGTYMFLHCFIFLNYVLNSHGRMLSSCTLPLNT